MAAEPHHRADGVILEQGEPVVQMHVVCAGRADVQVNGTLTATLGPGAFIGEMGFLTGDPATATVRATEPTRTVVWPAVALKSYLARNPDLRAAWQLLIGTDLAAKLKAS